MTALRRRTLLTALLAGGAATACTGEDGTSAGGGGGGATGGDDGHDGSGGPGPDDLVAEPSFHLGSIEVAVGVHPLVRSDEHLVLTLDLAAEVDAADLEEQWLFGEDLAGEVTSCWSDGWGGASGGDPRDLLGVRLVDLAGDQVASTAVDAEGGTVGLGVDTTEATDSGSQALRGTVQIAFADPGTDSLAVYLPKLPLVTEVPVLDAEVPEVDGAEEQLDLAAIEEAPLEPMLAMSQDLAQPLLETRDAQTTSVAISSDVLFDSSSAELDDAAQSALDEAARRIGSHEPGPVLIVGHTDSVDSESFNLTLSQERAQAVADAIEDRVDTSRYPLSTDGKGESSPIASNDTEEGRALNRRVEIVLETALREETATTEMPDFEGRKGAADEGVQFDGTEHNVLRPFDLQLGAARMLEGHLVITLEVTPTDEEHGGVTGIGQFDSGTTMPAEPDGVSTYTLLASCGAVGVLVGSVLTYPAFHDAGGPRATTRPLTDLSMNSPADGGVPRILELVYPRDVAGVEEGAEIALQYGATSALDFADEETWRLEGVRIDS